VLPERCDVAKVRVLAKRPGAGSAKVLTLRAEDDGEPKETAYSQHMKAVARIALGTCDLRPNVRAKLPAEAGAVSLVRDDAPCAADQAYSACRSGSA